MIHIIKNKAGKFDVVNIARNGNFLSGSKQGFNRKIGAVKNIRAHMKLFGATVIVVQDDTWFPSMMLTITATETWFTEDKPGKCYVPKKVVIIFSS